MKKLLIVFFTLLCGLVYCQEVGRPIKPQQDYGRYVVSDREAAITVIDSLLRSARYEYRYNPNYKWGTSPQRDIFPMMFETTLDTGEKKRVQAVFEILLVGENKALEQSGHIIYRFDYMSGPYLDIFPVWQKYFDPTADKEAIAEKGYGPGPIENGHVYSVRADDQTGSGAILCTARPMSENR